MRLYSDLPNAKLGGCLWTAFRASGSACWPVDLLLPDRTVQRCVRPCPEYADREHFR